MRSNDGQRSGRRSGRRGSRRRPRGTNSGPTQKIAVAAKKQSLFERIISFFKRGTKKPAATPQRAPVASGVRSTEPSRPARKPEAVEVVSPKLYVGNLSYDATESDLFELFRGIGSVRNAEVVSHKVTMKSKGFGFVTMATVEEAKRAVEVLHDKDFMGRKLVVSGAKTNDVRFASADSNPGEVSSEEAA